MLKKRKLSSERTGTLAVSSLSQEWEHPDPVLFGEGTLDASHHHLDLGPLTIWFLALFLNDLVDPLVQVFVLAGYLESREKMWFENIAVCPSEFKPARGVVLQIPWQSPALPQR